MRRVFAVATLIAALFALPAPVLAHGDVRLADQTIELAPGESARFDGTLHYHRLVGRIIADGELVVRLIHSETGTVAVERGPTREFAFNELIRCCDERTWAPHVLLIENVGDQTVSAQAGVGLVHDDLAVMVYGAESGTNESIVVLGGIWAAVLWRAVRRPPAAGRLRRAGVAFTLLVGSVTVLGWYGAARYGGSGAPALLAALSDLPILPPNPIVSRATLLLGALLIGWGLAGA